MRQCVNSVCVCERVLWGGGGGGCHGDINTPVVLKTVSLRTGLNLLRQSEGMGEGKGTCVFAKANVTHRE